MESELEDKLLSDQVQKLPDHPGLKADPSESIQAVHIGNGAPHHEEGGAEFNCHQQPHREDSEKLSMKRNPDGTWGPTGLYGGRLKETKLLTALRLAVKPSRLKRVEQVLKNRCQRVQCLFENLNDPANGAACLRTMEGFGVLVAHAVEAYEPFHVTGGITMHADKVR